MFFDYRALAIAHLHLWLFKPQRGDTPLAMGIAHRGSVAKEASFSTEEGMLLH
jgi:hypothetical protein